MDDMRLLLHIGLAWHCKQWSAVRSTENLSRLGYWSCTGSPQISIKSSTIFLNIALNLFFFVLYCIPLLISAWRHKVKATSAAASIKHQHLQPNCWWLSCIVGNVLTRFWQGKDETCCCALNKIFFHCDISAANTCYQIICQLFP